MSTRSFRVDFETDDRGWMVTEIRSRVETKMIKPLWGEAGTAHSVILALWEVHRALSQRMGTMPTAASPTTEPEGTKP